MMSSVMGACDFSVINKAAREAKESDTNPIGDDVDLVHHDNHHRPSPSYQIGVGDGVGGGGGGGGGGGPTCNNNDNSGSHIYNAIGDVSFAGLKTLQPFEFDIATTVTAAATATQSTIKSPEGMAATMGFPFTNAQRKELERQALIYKYMVASVPVPLDLLFPFTRNSAATPVAVASGLNLLRFSKGGDLEPVRCRRTDGKKWRCSRDVAPDQKYCERHLHRGRPRSRKPVELAANNKKKTRLQPYRSTNTSASPSQVVGNFAQYHPTKEQRCLDWMLRGEAEAVHIPSPAGQEWHHLINNSSVINQHYVEEHLNLNSFTNFSAGEDQQSNNCPLFIKPDLAPRGFIDAWSSGVSKDDHNAKSGTKTSVSSSGNLSPCPLRLSMGGNNIIDEETSQLQMGLGLVESSQEHECDKKTPLSSWLHPVSWEGSAPGGPLAEVLRPSRVPASGPRSPAGRNGESDSSPATTVSSQSRVQHKTLVSWSDSSGNSSPIVARSRNNKPEISLFWLRQSNLNLL